jgi:hypothetical protein
LVEDDLAVLVLKPAGDAGRIGSPLVVSGATMTAVKGWFIKNGD